MPRPATSEHSRYRVSCRCGFPLIARWINGNRFAAFFAGRGAPYAAGELSARFGARVSRCPGCGQSLTEIPWEELLERFGEAFGP